LCITLIGLLKLAAEVAKLVFVALFVSGYVRFALVVMALGVGPFTYGAHWHPALLAPLPALRFSRRLAVGGAFIGHIVTPLYDPARASIPDLAAPTANHIRIVAVERPGVPRLVNSHAVRAPNVI